MKHPLLYEINTRCWLRSLSEKHGKTITLANVPASEVARLQKLGFTHVWAMGVWTVGYRSRTQALESDRLRERFSNVLPGWTEKDVPGSPYAIADYKVPDALGGEEGLKAFREKLNSKGLKLILDFVPNHVGLDHVWTIQAPELFVKSTEEMPGTFRQQTSVGEYWYAYGKDPHFAPWTDTVQLNYRRRETHAEMTHVLESLARRCDGVRCDMAMLITNEVFARTWVHFPEMIPPPAEGFWARSIPIVRKVNPHFLFLGEVYWGMEQKMLSLGFDYVYDKAFYDLLKAGHGADEQSHLLSLPPYQLAASAHFLENHDELRSAAVFQPAKLRAAALLMLGSPGMRFIYEGQLEGRRIQIPVQLARWPDEPPNPEIEEMYKKLFAALKRSVVGQGKFTVLKPEALPGDFTAENVIAIKWQKTPGEFDLVVVNLASQAGRVRLAPDVIPDGDWQMADLLSRKKKRFRQSDVAAGCICLDLHADGAELLKFRLLKS